MCFLIDNNAARWRERIVYKIVRRKGKRLCSPQAMVSIDYETGVQVKIRRGAKISQSSSWHPGDRQTRAGIYVMQNMDYAKRYLSHFFDCRDMRIIALKVDPRSFLHAARGANGYDGCATYRRATPTGALFSATGRCIRKAA